MSDRALRVRFALFVFETPTVIVDLPPVVTAVIRRRAVVRRARSHFRPNAVIRNTSSALFPPAMCARAWATTWALCDPF